LALAPPSPSIAQVARLMLFVRRPYVLSEEDAARWMREQASTLARVSAVDRVELIRLQAPALHGGGDCEWLIEMHFERGEDAARAARDDACRDLVADLRLLGMRPQLVVADGAERLEG
jgi:hypothetical protein